MTQTTNQSPWQNDRKQWLLEKEREAEGLIQLSERICRQLFASGDLSAFLALLSRLHQYDYRNLLLIYHQYPSATCLGSFSVWQKLHSDPAKMVLNQKGIKKGIRLLAPFTVYDKGSYHLIWYSIRQYDVSQTNLTDHPSVVSPYKSDDNHIKYLTEAVRAVLSDSFQKSLLLLPKQHSGLSPQLSYSITPEAVVMRSQEPLISRLQYMTEAIGRLSASQGSLPPAQQILFAQCICHCLFVIWGHPNNCPAPSSGSKITSFPVETQLLFLDLLQRTVRQVEESVACAYRMIRKDADTDLLDGASIEEFLGFQPGVKL